MTWIMSVIVFLGVVVAILFNRLVRDRNRVDAAWSDIDVQLQRRHDLIPQLVKAVDQYAGYEKATLEAVTTLRAEAIRLSRLCWMVGKGISMRLLFDDSEVPVFHDLGMAKTAGKCFVEHLCLMHLKVAFPEL